VILQSSSRLKISELPSTLVRRCGVLNTGWLLSLKRINH